MFRYPSLEITLSLTRLQLAPQSRYRPGPRTGRVPRTYQNDYQQYYWVALATLLSYDYFLTLRDEVRTHFFFSSSSVDPSSPGKICMEGQEVVGYVI